MYLVGYIPELLTAVDSQVTVGYEKFFVGIIKTLVSTAAMMAGKADYEAIKAGNKYFANCGVYDPVLDSTFPGLRRDDHGGGLRLRAPGHVASEGGFGGRGAIHT